jgi:hypothetical protein
MLLNVIVRKQRFEFKICVIFKIDESLVNILLWQKLIQLV